MFNGLDEIIIMQIIIIEDDKDQHERIIKEGGRTSEQKHFQILFNYM